MGQNRTTEGTEVESEPEHCRPPRSRRPSRSEFGYTHCCGSPFRVTRCGRIQAWPVCLEARIQMRVRGFTAVVIMFVSLISAAAHGQCSDWVRPTQNFRPMQEQGSLTFDAARGVSVLSGSGSGAGPIGTWLWNGSAWAQVISQNSPSSAYYRPLCVTAFDASRGVVVLYGGREAYLPVYDTWEWDGVNWKQRALTGPVLQNYSMVYNASRKRIVLFGYHWYQPHMWTWDGASWDEDEASMSPPVRASFGLAYDFRRDRLVLFGGEWVGLLDDTWELVGDTWTQRNPPTSPPPRKFPVLVYDSLRGITVLFGGAAPNGVSLNDTWEWDGENWTQAEASVSPPASWTLMGGTFDSRRGKTIIHYQNSSPAPETGVWEYPAQSRPVIRTSPKGQSACLGSLVAMGVEAFSETPATYQWRRNGSAIQDATSNTLCLPAVDHGSPGTYDVAVTNACGTTISEPATLLVCAGAGGCPSPVDVNGDGVIDGLDIERIVQVLLNLQ